MTKEVLDEWLSKTSSYGSGQQKILIIFCRCPEESPPHTNPACVGYVLENWVDK